MPQIRFRNVITTLFLKSKKHFMTKNETVFSSFAEKYEFSAETMKKVLAASTWHSLRLKKTVKALTVFF